MFLINSFASNIILKLTRSQAALRLTILGILHQHHHHQEGNNKLGILTEMKPFLKCLFNSCNALNIVIASLLIIFRRIFVIDGLVISLNLLFLRSAASLMASALLRNRRLLKIMICFISTKKSLDLKREFSYISIYQRSYLY